MTHPGTETEGPRKNTHWWLLPSVHGLIILAVVAAWAILSTIY